MPGAGAPPPPPGSGPGFGGPGFGGPGFGGPGFGGPGFGGPAFQGAQAPSRSGKALAALITGIAGLVLCFLFVPALVALILGILALREIGRSNGMKTGKGMAIAGVVLGALGVVAGGAFIAVVVNEVAGTTSVFDLEVGDCTELPDDGEEISRIETFECTEPHGAEVVSIGVIGEDGDPYPGTDELIDLIGAECIDDFTAYVGKDYLQSDFNLFPITPTEATWDDDRSYVCLAFDPAGDLTESIKGSGR